MPVDAALTRTEPSTSARHEPVVVGFAGVIVAAYAVATAYQVARGWAALADDAAIASRAWDVLDGDLPLVGQYTLAGSNPRHPIYDLGPLYYWLLAVPVHLDPRSGPLWGAALVCAAGSVLTVVAAFAAFGRRGAVAAGLASVVLIWQVPAVLLDPTWNPNAGAVWFLAAMACASAVVAGRLRWLPALVFSASLAAQLNLVYVAPVIAVFLFGAVAAPLVARRRRAGWIWLLAGAGVGAALWVPTLVQEATGRPGNLTLLFSEFGRGSGVHLAFGLRALSAVVDPRVLQWSTVRGSTVVEPLARVAGETVVPAVVLIAVLAAVAALGVATARRGLALATGMAAAVCAAVVATFTFLPQREAEAAAYLSIALMVLTCAVVGLAVVAAARGLRRLVPARLGGRAAWGVVAIGFAAVALTARTATVAAGSVTTWRSVRAVDETAAYVESHVPRGDKVVVGFAVDHAPALASYDSYEDAAGTAWHLQADGWRPALPGAVAPVFGPGPPMSTHDLTVASVRLDGATGSVLGVAFRDPGARN